MDHDDRKCFQARTPKGQGAKQRVPEVLGKVAYGACDFFVLMCREWYQRLSLESVYVCARRLGSNEFESFGHTRKQTVKNGHRVMQWADQLPPAWSVPWKNMHVSHCVLTVVALCGHTFVTLKLVREFYMRRNRQRIVSTLKFAFFDSPWVPKVMQKAILLKNVRDV